MKKLRHCHPMYRLCWLALVLHGAQCSVKQLASTRVDCISAPPSVQTTRDVTAAASTACQ